MKFLITIALSFVILICSAQTKEDVLTAIVKVFHHTLVTKNTVSINRQTDEALSYGHSNGWIEDKTALIKDLETGLISYQSFKEDSIAVSISENVANVRFKAEVEATLNGVKSTFKIKVLEVWVKRDRGWILFARQAVKA